jgi:hypothetical protein
MCALFVYLALFDYDLKRQLSPGGCFADLFQIEHFLRDGQFEWLKSLYNFLGPIDRLKVFSFGFINYLLFFFIILFFVLLNALDGFLTFWIFLNFIFWLLLSYLRLWSLRPLRWWILIIFHQLIFWFGRQWPLIFFLALLKSI